MNNYNGTSIIIPCACAYFNNDCDDNCDFDNDNDYNYDYYDYDSNYDGDNENYDYDQLNSISTEIRDAFGRFHHFFYGHTYLCQGFKCSQHICLSQWGIHNGRHLTENYNLESGTIICKINYNL